MHICAPLRWRHLNNLWQNCKKRSNKTLTKQRLRYKGHKRRAFLLRNRDTTHYSRLRFVSIRIYQGNIDQIQHGKCPTPTHWSAAKRVLSYLQGTANRCLKYVRSRETLKGFVDTNWANCKMTGVRTQASYSRCQAAPYHGIPQATYRRLIFNGIWHCPRSPTKPYTSSLSWRSWDTKSSHTSSYTIITRGRQDSPKITCTP